MTHFADNAVLWDGDSPQRVIFHVPGDPVPQGSKRHVGKGILIEASKRLRPWRNDVVDTIRALELPTFTGPVSVQAVFHLKRAKNHYGTGKNAGTLKKSAPEYVGLRPDIDKLSRALLDAMTTSGLLRDDGQVAVLVAEKRYGDTPGVRVAVRSLP